MSRDRRLRDCARKYYLHHYASVGGRRAEESSVARDIYILKHLRNRYMWVGEVVHELIELTLNAWRRHENVSIDGLVARGTRRMRAHYAESLQGIYRERPAQACGLVEHEYSEAVSRAEWQAQRDRMERCLRTFFALPLTDEIRATPSWRWLALEAMSSFDLDGATILVKPDFAWRDPQGRVMLADWKTGQPRPNEQAQLAVYGIFAQRVWGLGADTLQAQLVYLDSGHIDSYDLGLPELQEAEEEVRASVARMRLLAGQGEGAPNPEDFPRTEVLHACSRCAFRRICGRS